MLLKRKRIKFGIRFFRSNQYIDPCIGCSWYKKVGNIYACDAYEVHQGKTIGKACSEIYGYHDDGKYAYFPEKKIGT